MSNHIHLIAVPRTADGLVPLTTEEIDEHLRATDRGWVLEDHLFSAIPEVVAMARSIASGELLEKDTLAEDVEKLEYGGHTYWINPVNDISWNFEMTKRFVLDVAIECSSHIANLRSQQVP